MFAPRELLLLVLFSILLTILCTNCFRQKPATRRLLIIIGSVLFVVLPPTLTVLSLSWTMEVTAPSTWAENLVLPAAVPQVFLTIGALWSLLVIWRTARERYRLKGFPCIEDPRILTIAEEYQHLLRYGGEVRFRSGPAPCTSSLGTPTVVLPAASASWSERTLRVVIAHELVHLYRFDDRWLSLLRLMCRFYCWLPWLGLLERAFDRAMEESCDDLASRLVRSDSDYLTGVFNVVSQSGQRLLPGLPNLGRHPLLRRFQRFNRFRDQEIDARGLYWCCLSLSLTIAFSWTLRLVEVPAADAGMAAERRIVAIVTGGDSAQLQLTLIPKDRGPPMIDRAGFVPARLRSQHLHPKIRKNR